MIIIVAIIIASVALGLFLLGFIWNMVVESNPANKTFLSGSVPKTALNGPYNGFWASNSSWEGKELDSSKNTGANIIDGTKKYPFETSTTKSLHSNQQVMRLNYNIAENPLWLRFIADELVETSPGKYQGKVYVQFLPGLAITVTYFRLEK